MPRVLNGKEAIKALSRGFYGAVFVTRHPRTGRLYAVKAIPTATYAAREDGGYGKSFEEEVEIHRALSGSPVVARLEDWGTDTVEFGSELISCHWMEMEFVEGALLDDLIAHGPESPREVAQIAWDLLDVIDELQKRGKFHNDFHGRNIVITKLPETEARRAAIDPYVAVKVLDLGSADSATKSGSTRQGDIHWVAQHILELLSALELGSTLDPTPARVCAQLRRVADHYFGETDHHRPPTPADMKDLIRSAYAYGRRPWMQPVRLASVAAHYNARTMPAWFAPELLNDPEGAWSRRLAHPGPQLIYGMRGCGKTVLLRSLEWAARLHARVLANGRESEEQVRDRVAGDDFLGLFVSCSSLLRGPRSELVDAPLHRTFLAFSREIVRNVEICDLWGIGEIDYRALPDFAELVARVVPWFEPAGEALDVLSLEDALSRAITTPGSGSADAEFTPHVVFEDLAEATRRLVDIWENKRLLFLLDDVSTRVLSEPNVEELLTQLCLGSQHFAFKISTESQTIVPRTSGGELARAGRDYDLFDFGHEVYEHLGGKDGVAFISGILDRRAAVTDGAPDRSRDALASQKSLEAVSQAIRDAGGAHYWGIEALAGICVGDIGDVLQLYETILDRGADRGYPIKPEIQHKAAIDLAESKLRSLLLRNEWLYSHATAFAQAAHRELMADSDRTRQFSRVDVSFPADQAERLFPRIIELVDAGVYVFSGGTARKRTARHQPVLQFKLVYRKLLGLPSGIPLGRRDRFEPENVEELLAWLESPTPSSLRWGKLPVDEPAAEPERRPSVEVRGEPDAEPAQLLLHAERASSEDLLPAPRSLLQVSTMRATEGFDIGVEWSETFIVSAFGFEDRSVGTWRQVVDSAAAAQAILVSYPNPGHRSEIEDLLSSARIPWREVPVATLTNESVAATLDGIPDGAPLVIDTTALTKALIYQFVADGLRRRGELWILHGCAEHYEPSDDALRPVVERLVGGNLPAIRELDELVEGEVGPYTTESLGVSRRDPGQPTLLATFVPLKHARVAQLLDDVPVEKVAAIVPLHSDGRDSPRTVAAEYLADHYVQQYGGEKVLVGSLDHDGAYRELAELHSRYALDLGYNFEVALSGTKMHAVGVGMLAATTPVSAVYYSRPHHFEPHKFTHGTGAVRTVHLVLGRGDVTPAAE